MTWLIPVGSMVAALLSDDAQEGVTSLARGAVRRDHPSYRWFVILLERDSDPILVSGHADLAGAVQVKGRLDRDWGHILDAGWDDIWKVRVSVLRRDQLEAAGIDFGERYWMKGSPVFASVEDRVEATQLALHNAYLFTYGEPPPWLAEAVAPASADYDVKFADVLIFIERGYPDHMGWWRKVEADLARQGHNAKHESIDAGLYALYWEPAGTWSKRIDYVEGAGDVGGLLRVIEQSKIPQDKSMTLAEWHGFIAENAPKSEARTLSEWLEANARRMYEQAGWRRRGMAGSYATEWQLPPPDNRIVTDDDQVVLTMHQIRAAPGGLMGTGYTYEVTIEVPETGLVPWQFGAAG